MQTGMSEDKEEGGGAETPAPVPRPDPPQTETPGGEMAMASDQTANFTHPDVATAAASQRRFLPPDSKPMLWYVKYREQLRIVEMALTGLFLLLALYFLYMWIFSRPEVTYAPGREGFVKALSAYQPARVESSWRVKATPGRWRNIVLHHTATEKGDPEAIDRFHREVRKWENGLGYHFLIGNGNGLADGEVYPSRRWREQLDGAHVQMQGHSNGNSFAIGVALVGNFEERIPTPRQLASLRGLLHFLMMEYGIMHGEVVGHGDVAAKHTLCPGSFFYLDEVVKSL